MEIAAQDQFDAIPNFALQLSEQSGMTLTVVFVFIVSVRRGDHVGDAVKFSHLDHLDGHLPGARTVIDHGKNVGVDVDH